MSWNGIEQRQHKRFGVKSCIVQYKPAGFFGLFSTTSPRYLVLNIGQNGLNFISHEELYPGQSFLLFINAPLLDDEFIKITGRVVWVKKSVEYNAYRTGLVFKKLFPRAQTKLKLILDNALLDKIDISTRVYLKEVEKL
ncbi:MAG: PilZ domain-containing protein [Planctomycetota bacterium]